MPACTSLICFSNPAPSAYWASWTNKSGLQRSRRLGATVRSLQQYCGAKWADSGKGLPQLLRDPLRRRVLGQVEVPDLSASAFDDEEAAQQLKCHRRDSEEVKGSDHLAVIVEKSQPLLLSVSAAPNTP